METLTDRKGSPPNASVSAYFIHMSVKEEELNDSCLCLCVICVLGWNRADCCSTCHGPVTQLSVETIAVFSDGLMAHLLLPDNFPSH
jgi:hypothetical protein